MTKLPAVLLVLAVALATPLPNRAQSRAGSRLAFDVASIRPHLPTPGPFRSTKDVGEAGITFTNVDLNSSIRSAYGVASYQIAGGLSWLTPDRYDIVAKAAVPASKTQLMLMLQTLLEDRFKLRVHREIKDLPVFGLIVGKKGLKSHPGKEGGETEVGGNAHLISSRGMSMKDLASFLSQFTATSGRPVVDMTGLSGLFDITLNFVRDDLARGDNNADPDIFAALDEIGLKLESRTSPIEVLMIDHAEKPSDN
jgi:uncharacterized protein (TIGR03435 family)